MRIQKLLSCLAIALVLPSLAGAAEVVIRLYEVHYLPVHEAGLLARQKCLDRRGEECQYVIKQDRFFELHADADTHDVVRALLKERDVPPATQVFQVTLLIAREGQPSRPVLPESAGSALDDLEDFLPFRNYRLLDAGIMRTADRAHISLGGDLGYEASLRFRGDPRLGNPLQIDLDLEQFTPVVVPGTGSGPDAKPPRQELRGREIVETSFSMRVGETVVVGNSKLDGGDEALVVLVTAVAGG